MTRNRVPIMAVVLALTVVSANPLGLRAQGPSDDFLLSEGKAGPIYIGLDVDEIRRRFGKERVRLIDLDLEGRFSPAIEINLPGAGLQWPLIASISQGLCGIGGEFHVDSIIVRDPKFRTADDLGVGSTLAQLREARNVTLSREEGIGALDVPGKIGFGLDGDSNDGRVVSVRLWMSASDAAARHCPRS